VSNRLLFDPWPKFAASMMDASQILDLRAKLLGRRS